MRRALHLFLILLLTVSSVSFGAARGQARVAGQVVLCTGANVTTIHVDENGAPVEHVLLCPDMVLSLIAGQLGIPPVLRPPDSAVRAALFPASAMLTARVVPVPRARGPPVSAA